MIGGNTDCILKYETFTTSAIGEQVKSWVELITLKGFLDLMNQNKDYGTYNKAIETSTHIFICDYVSIQDKDENGNKRELKATIDGEDYNVTYIDNPMKLNKHLEIFLEKVG